MKKAVSILIMVLILGFVWIIVLRPMMGETLFTQAVKARLGVDPLADYSDGLHVILIGTGSPLADPKRAGPSTAIMAGNALYVVDSGGASVRKMGTLGVSPARVKAVLLTHFHSDHFDGLGELMLQRWAGGGHNLPLPVYGPQGVDTIIEGLNTAYSLDRDYRIAHHGDTLLPPRGFGGMAHQFDGTRAVKVLEDGELTITAFPVNHAPVDPAVGYIFAYKGRIVGITGDAVYTPALAEHMRGTELLIAEALDPEMVGIMGRIAREKGLDTIAQIAADIPDYHMTPEDAARLAKEVRASQLVLTHIVPALPHKALHTFFLGEAPVIFKRDITIGEDGLIFSLPAGSDNINRGRL